MTLVGAPGRIGWMVGLTLAGVLAAAAPLRAEPVEDLRKALALDDVFSPTPKNLQDRRERLTKLIQELHTIGELRRSLVLSEWRDDPIRQGVDPAIRDIDTEIREEIGLQLEERLNNRAITGNVADRIALANLIAEMGSSVRALNPNDFSGFSRTLLPVVEHLSHDADVGVRLEALRAISNINARPEAAAKILGDALTRDGASGSHRVAAYGLGHMVRVTSYLNQSGIQSAPVKANSDEVLQTATEVIGACALGLHDIDPVVRRHCADAFQAAASVLEDLIPKTMEVDLVKGKVVAVDALPKAVKKLQPALAALRKHVGALTPTVHDANLRVRRSAALALVEVAAARQRFCLLVLDVREIAEADRKKFLAADPLQDFLDKNLGAVDRLAASDDAQLRNSAALFLLHAAAPLLADKDANPLAGRMRVGLNDSELATRFIAARALGNMLRDERRRAIDPALIKAALPDLARLLSDTNLWVRIATAETLQLIGPDATATAEAVALAATRGDAEGRIAALKALNEFKLDLLSAEDQKRVLDPLVEVLGQSELDDKALAAVAETLGQIGPTAKAALPALRRLLNHDDSGVRSAVTEAILAINR